MVEVFVAKTQTAEFPITELFVCVLMDSVATPSEDVLHTNAPLTKIVSRTNGVIRMVLAGILVWSKVLAVQTPNAELSIDRRNVHVLPIMLEIHALNVRSVEVMNVFAIRVERIQDVEIFLVDLNVAVHQDVSVIRIVDAFVTGNKLLYAEINSVVLTPLAKYFRTGRHNVIVLRISQLVILMMNVSNFKQIVHKHSFTY